MEQLASSPQGLSLKNKSEQLDTALKGSKCTKLLVNESEEICSICIDRTVKKLKKTDFNRNYG